MTLGQASYTTTRNGQAVPVAETVVLAPAAFQRSCVELCRAGARLAALVPVPAPAGGQRLVAVLADDRAGRLLLVSTELGPGAGYPALTAELPQAQAFERELFELHGIHPEGHPWLKPLRRHDDLEPAGGTPPPAHPFFRVEGAGVHEVAVGPVHAGIIEPGHFRFQCSGETVHTLEIQLGYQHRGLERLLLTAPPARQLALVESVAGDTSVGHALAWCSALEGLSEVEIPLPAHLLRAIGLELERLANHVGDLGALANDVGYLPAASWLGRLRGDFLNFLLELCGNRFGRGLVTPGGVRFGLEPQQRQDLLGRLARMERDVTATVELMLGTASVLSRFEHTGIVPHRLAEELGLVGPAARASGCERDVRQDHPAGAYRFSHLPLACTDGGDVLGRALVRWIEAQRSMTFVREQLTELPAGALSCELPAPRPRALVVAMVEGWRGEIVHVAVTGDDGLCAYKIVDPSFHNWFGLAMALRGNQISDFPLCNKSFNLSYAGHDL